MSTAFLFPGQGAQHVGMGRDLYDAFPAARACFDAAEEISGLPLKKLCFEGPEEDLARTDVAQPAIFVHSAAVLASLASLLGPERLAELRPSHLAGLSLGEYTALFAAGMIGFDDGVRLVTRRGAAMQAAAEAVSSGMVAVIGLEEDDARALCQKAAQGQVLTPANFNCPGQIVLSGDLEACRRAEAMASEFGARGATPLNVAGAFHCELMAPAAEELRGALAEVTIRTPGPPDLPGDGSAADGPAWGQAFAAAGAEVLANVDAQPYDDPGSAGEKLLAQLTGTVRWTQCVQRLLDRGVDRFFEIGPGKVLKGLMRRIDRKADCTCIPDVESIENMADPQRSE